MIPVQTSTPPMGHEPQIAYVRVFVRDFERAVRFYTETLGFALASRDDEVGWAQLVTFGTTLALERVDNTDPADRQLVGRFLGLSLAVPDVTTAFQTLVNRGVIFTHPPTRTTWGGTLAHFEDSEQNVLTLVSVPSSD